MPLKRISWCCVPLLALLSLLTGNISGTDINPIRRVLVINEVSTAWPGIPLIDEGIRSELEPLPYKVEFIGSTWTPSTSLTLRTSSESQKSRGTCKRYPTAYIRRNSSFWGYARPRRASVVNYRKKPTSRFSLMRRRFHQPFRRKYRLFVPCVARVASERAEIQRSSIFPRRTTWHAGEHRVDRIG